MPDPAAEHGQWAAGRGQRAGGSSQAAQPGAGLGGGTCASRPTPTRSGPLCPGVPGGAVHAELDPVGPKKRPQVRVALCVAKGSMTSRGGRWEGWGSRLSPWGPGRKFCQVRNWAMA